MLLMIIVAGIVLILLTMVLLFKVSLGTAIFVLLMLSVLIAMIGIVIYGLINKIPSSSNDDHHYRDRNHDRYDDDDRNHRDNNHNYRCDNDSYSSSDDSSCDSGGSGSDD